MDTGGMVVVWRRMEGRMGLGETANISPIDRNMTRRCGECDLFFRFDQSVCVYQELFRRAIRIIKTTPSNRLECAPGGERRRTIRHRGEHVCLRTYHHLLECSVNPLGLPSGLPAVLGHLRDGVLTRQRRVQPAEEPGIS